MVEPADYVALGDSYAAGVGAGELLGNCRHTDLGYPLAVAAGLDLSLSWPACIAATIGDVLRDQLDDLGRHTRRVSITVGGNDIGFSPVLVSAAQPAWMSDTDVVIDAALHRLREDLPALLDGLYAEVRTRAPEADVLVTTYPRLFNGQDCSLFTFFDPVEMARLNEAADELAASIAAAADRAGFECVDVIEEFVGHAACDEAEWIRGVSWPVEESFHPNADGHAAYTRLVGKAWGAPPARPEPLEIARTEDRHGPATQGSAPTFAVPDLLSMVSLEGAARHGLDPDEVERLARRIDVDPEARLHLLEFDHHVRESRARARRRHTTG